MHLSIQLCGLLLYALVTTASTQERERQWHSTTPPPPSVSGVSVVDNLPVAAEPEGEAPPVVPAESVAPAELPTSELNGPRDIQGAEDVLTVEKTPEDTSAVEGNKEKKDRKWISAPKEEVKEEKAKDEVVAEKKERKWISAPGEEVKQEEKTKVEDAAEKKERKWISAPKEDVKEEEKTASDELSAEKKERKWISAPTEDVKEEKVVKDEGATEKKVKDEVATEKKERKWISAPKKEEVKVTEEENKVVPELLESESVEESQNLFSEEANGKKKKKQPRKWVSVPGMALDEEPVAPPTKQDIATAKESLDIAKQAVVEGPLKSSERSVEKSVLDVPLTELDAELPANITELLLAAEEGFPLVQETIVSRKTTVYVTISESVDAEPLFVNLTGIRHYTGQERRMMAGCLDLSDLMLTGEDAKEVIQRMSKHKFHKLDLSNNNITEFPANTFSPVAFTVRELRLDGNPLASNDQGEASVLQRGGLFHLTELRELNLTGCGLQDMDYFTPWNSNHLEVVDLSNNKLSSVPSNLQFFHKLKKLFLDGNPITQVSELPFALLWNMQILSLADCQVATIEDDPFRNMDKLKELSLEGNNLTQIGHVRLPRSNSGVKMFLSGNPWHCACEMLNFIEHYNYAIRDIEYIRCASPRWLEGLRTAYLTKEILSLDTVDGDCTPQSPRVSSTRMVVPPFTPGLHADRLQLLALIVFVMAALFMLCHVLWARKKDKYRFEDDRDDIHYIRIEKKPNFK